MKRHLNQIYDDNYLTQLAQQIRSDIQTNLKLSDTDFRINLYYDEQNKPMFTVYCTLGANFSRSNNNVIGPRFEISLDSIENGDYEKVIGIQLMEYLPDKNMNFSILEMMIPILIHYKIDYSKFEVLFHKIVAYTVKHDEYTYGCVWRDMPTLMGNKFRNVILPDMIKRQEEQCDNHMKFFELLDKEGGDLVCQYGDFSKRLLLIEDSENNSIQFTNPIFMSDLNRFIYYLTHECNHFRNLFFRFYGRDYLLPIMYLSREKEKEECLLPELCVQILWHFVMVFCVNQAVYKK